jgi:hypothetical protein
MEEFFKKIEVKTVNDLPKEDTVIYGKCKSSVQLERIEFYKKDLSCGLSNIEWYLTSVSKEDLQNEICLYPKITK